MGDMAEDFKAFKAHKDEVRSSVEPSRVDYARKRLSELKNVSVSNTDGVVLLIKTEFGNVQFWPYTGWFCGMKPIGSIKGRGISNLLKQLKERKDGK